MAHPGRHHHGRAVARLNGTGPALPRFATDVTGPSAVSLPSAGCWRITITWTTAPTPSTSRPPTPDRTRAHRVGGSSAVGRRPAEGCRTEFP